MARTPIAAVVLLFLAAPTASAQDATLLRPAIAARYPDVAWVTTAELSRWLHDERPVILLDVRARSEYDVSHLERAVWIDGPRLDPERLPIPRDARVAVYCSVGWRSAAVVARLRAAGFDAYNLAGGIFQWANEGRPLRRSGRPVREVHPYDEVWGRFLRRELWADPG